GQVAYQGKRSDHPQDQKQEREQRQLHCFLSHHRLHVVEIDAGANNPAPRLIAFNIGALGYWLVHAWLWPEVLPKALALGACDIGESDEETVAGGIFVTTQVRAVELGFVGVHHHERMHIVDPEVLRFVIPELLDGGYGGTLRLVPLKLTALRQITVMGEKREGDLDQ